MSKHPHENRRLGLRKETLRKLASLSNDLLGQVAGGTLTLSVQCTNNTTSGRSMTGTARCP